MKRTKTLFGIAVLVIAAMTVLAGLSSCSKSRSRSASGNNVSLVNYDDESGHGGEEGGYNYDESPASDFQVGFNETEDGVVIERYLGTSEVVVIPAEIEGFPVREIRYVAFAGHLYFYGETNCNDITLIIIPEGVTKIGQRAFAECDNLESVIIPSSVIEIEFDCFVLCPKLSSITLPDGITEIPRDLFLRCTSLTSITIPKNVISIGREAFSCTGLTSITIPDNVIDIGYGAFKSCDSLTSITIPDNVIKIGDSAFAWCKNLVTVTISPVEGRKWGEGGSVFASCSKLSLASQSALKKAGYMGRF